MKLHRKVLLITYYFPPVGGGGVIRILKFAKYLPLFNWQPVIVTATVSGITHDETLLDELPTNTQIYRTSVSFWGELKFKLLRKVFVQPSQAGKQVQEKPHPKYNILYGITKALEKLKKPIESWFLIPDQHVTWVRSATRLASKVIENNTIEAIITSGPPHSVHLVGLALSKKYNIPWIVDFRDDWYSNPILMPTTAFASLAIKRMEHEVVEHAKILMTVTPPLRDKIALRYKNQPNSKFVTIWNGFDTADYNSVSLIKKTTKYLDLRYVGSYSSLRTTTSLMTALATIKSLHPELFSLLHLTFIGQFADNQFRWREVFGDQISFRGQLIHTASVTAMLEADALLLLVTSHEGGATAMPGKIFEYMNARRPILALTAPGIITETITNLRLGWVANIDDAKEITQTLITILQYWQLHQKLPYEAKDRDLRLFDRKEQAGILAKLLDSITT